MIKYITEMKCDKCGKEVESFIRFRILSKYVDKRIENKDEEENCNLEYCDECFRNLVDNLVIGGRNDSNL